MACEMNEKEIKRIPLGYIKIVEGKVSIHINEEELGSIFTKQLDSIRKGKSIKEELKKKNDDNKNMIIVYGDESVNELVNKVIYADSKVDKLKESICILIRTTTKLPERKKYENFVHSIKKRDSIIYEFLIESEREANELKNGIRETDEEKRERLEKIEEKRERLKQKKDNYAFLIIVILSIITFVLITISVNWVFALISYVVYLPLIYYFIEWVKEKI